MLYYNVGPAEMPRSSDAKARSGMKWLRSNIKHGSRLALLALAIQFALSFGHFHGIAAQAVPALHQAAQSQQPASDHDSDRQSNDGCAICAVIAMAGTVTFATPPLLLLPQAIEFLYRTTDTESVRLNAVRVAFQPRAPPIS
jgi:Protein of unknown function (DUF2946)